MENIVASRKLRKSTLKDVSNKNLDVISNLTNVRNTHTLHNYSNEKIELMDDEKEINILSRLKNKVVIKVFFSVCIVFLCLVFKLVYPNILEQNQYLATIAHEYLKDYSKEDITVKIENFFASMYDNVKFIVPNDVTQKICRKYDNVIKPMYLGFDLKKAIYNISHNEENIINTPDNIETVSNETNLNESNVNLEEKQEKDEEINVEEKNIEDNTQNSIVNNEEVASDTGVGGGEPMEDAVIQSSSSVSIMESDAHEILAKNISIVKPVSGTITSDYGAREQIFEGVNSYHTGMDIANSLNTPIHSATNGVVTSTVNNNKYYGNYVEVETDGVIFKYAHLNSISVKKGDNVSQASEIGKMGSTGMSTGSHLHFEIKINSRTVDPALILKF